MSKPKYGDDGAGWRAVCPVCGQAVRGHHQPLDAALAKAREEGELAMREAAVNLSVTTRLRPDKPQERIAPSDVLTVARDAVAAYRDAIAALPTGGVK